MQHIPTQLDHGFEYIGGDISVDFANTTSYRYDPAQGHEHIQNYADLVEFARLAGALKPALAKRLLDEAQRHPDTAAQVYRRAAALREAVWGAFSKFAHGKEPSGADLQLISAEAAEALRHGQLMKHGDGYDWAWTDSDELARPLWPVARAAADLVMDPDSHSVIRECGDDVCAWLFVDRSRNHSRQWCDMRTCGNRAKQRRFAKRQAS